MSTESVIQEILQERQNQIERGYDTQFNSQWNMEQLTMAAAYYSIPSKMRGNYEGLWPWNKEKFTPEIGCSGRRHELVKAAALLTAELERTAKIHQQNKEEHTNEGIGKDRECVDCF